MRVGIDLDNVTYPFVEVLAQYVRPLVDDASKIDSVAHRWEFYEDWGLTTAQFLQFYKEAVEDDFMFVRGEPINQSVTWINQFRDMGHTIHFVTDRFVGNQAQQATVRWLQEYEIPYDSLTFSADKTLVKTDIFLDDKPSHVDDLRAVGVEAWLLNCGRSDQTGHPYLCTWTEFGWHVQQRAEALAAVVTTKPLTVMFDDDDTEPLVIRPLLTDPPPLPHGAFLMTTDEERVVNEATGGQKGRKLARTDLLPAEALWLLAEHYGKGGTKYADRNWELGVNWSLNYGAALRHLLQFWQGEDTDEETGSLHVIAAAWHCLALATYFKTHPELDDRPR